MLKMALFLSSALVSFGLTYLLGPVVLLVCPALALATVVWSMQDSRALKSVLAEAALSPGPSPLALRQAEHAASVDSAGQKAPQFEHGIGRYRT